MKREHSRKLQRRPSIPMKSRQKSRLVSLSTHIAAETTAEGCERNFRAQAAHRSPRQPYSRLPAFTSGTKGHTAFVPGNVLLRPSQCTEQRRNSIQSSGVTP